MSPLPLLLTTVAFVLLGLATDAHHRRRFGVLPSVAQCRRLRMGGWAALAAGFPAAVTMQGWVFGPILWAATVMAGAAIAFLALNLLPERPVRIAA